MPFTTCPHLPTLNIHHIPLLIVRQPDPMEVYLEGKFVHLAPHSIVGGPFHRATEVP